MFSVKISECQQILAIHYAAEIGDHLLRESGFLTRNFRPESRYYDVGVADGNDTVIVRSHIMAYLKDVSVIQC